MPPLKKAKGSDSARTKPLKPLVKQPKPRKEHDTGQRLVEGGETVGIKFSEWIVPGTHVRVDSTDNLVKENPICTVMPDGLHVSWGNCGRCMQRATNCDCRGVLHPTSIEWIYINILLKESGIDPTAPSGHVDSTHHEIISRGLFWYAKKRPGSSGVSWLVDSSANRPKPKALSKGAAFPSTPSNTPKRAKTLTRASKPRRTAQNDVQPDAPLPDLKQLDRDAEQDRNAAVQDAMKRLAKQTNDKPKKRLKKR